jgi:hypothetical protein
LAHFITDFFPNPSANSNVETAQRFNIGLLAFVKAPATMLLLFRPITHHAGSGSLRKALGVADGEGLAPGKALDVAEGERLALGTALFL